MRFLLVFFCLFLITACQDNPAPDSDYEDDFLLVAHQTMTPLDDDYSQDMNLKALVRNRIADGPDDGRWIRTTLPWLRLGSGELDTRDLDRLGERAEPLMKFLSTGTLSRIEPGGVRQAPWGALVGDPRSPSQDATVSRLEDLFASWEGRSTVFAAPILGRTAAKYVAVKEYCAGRIQ